MTAGIVELLVDYFTKACQLGGNMQKFTEIVEEFYTETTIDGYDALLALRKLFEPESDKREIIDFLKSELSNRDHEHLTFQTDEDPKTHHSEK